MDKTLLKGLQVLEFVARADRNVKIADVAGELGLTKSNAYRALKTLESAGFIHQDKVDKDFAASVKIWELGMQVVARIDLRSRAAKALQNLARRSNETVHLAVLDGTDVVYVDKIDSVEPVAAYTRLGGRAPAHAVATGKALLSQYSGAELKERLGALTRYSPSTIVDYDALQSDLDLSRARGFSINRGEWRESVWGIGAVIRDGTGAVVGAIGVSGPGYRLDDAARCEELAAMVVDAAEAISATFV